ncbi:MULTISPECIES: beta-eliminating lyase-related protein [unclassified Sphingopyxis]|uniref:threonine aldolase family protein n=1 Tax=unclassified Sphingopyxis TaxID=2614943 RepID=UPI000731724C|nr:MULTISPECIES: beta-eliminating lyase-related protein [unclassified Sphingopyxis]KTE26709.1 threonine aldolase [Sphingopyxis sp. H057]KTE53113.1 threonine aldolase [Sphingopyxis sp. H073]KTE55301.1 threonine aldolase [Sphingopyxis sp. H071]KTE58748.1 threonine aldolase [Sphingopyxis sp. H107]KTE64174.1 threonine aldolase [Sphingopyxis sp. H100]
MRFFSDNAATVHPAVMEALAAANHVDTAYDGDALSQSLDAAFSDLFETDCEVVWIATGTAANSIILAHFVRPWQGILCYEEAHIEVDECGAPTFYSGGAQLMTLPGAGAKIDAEALRKRIAGIRKDVHQVQPAAISITNATEYGLAWRASEIGAISEVAKASGMKLHMDGARFANAVAFLGCSPADVTWRAGVDALSFGFTKNGAMMAEALVFFGGSGGAGVRELKKRGGHLLSKGRFVAAQIRAMLKDDLWLANARAANAGAAALAAACGPRLMHPVEANELFVRISAEEAADLRAQGFDFYDWGDGAIRLVVSWDQDAAAVAPLAAAIAGL